MQQYLNYKMWSETHAHTHTHTQRIRPSILRFSQASSLFCGGKHQGAQREEETNNKLTHSPETLCLDCKHK